MGCTKLKTKTLTQYEYTRDHRPQRVRVNRGISKKKYSSPNTALHCVDRMLRRLTSRSGEKPVSGVFSSMGDAINNYKYFIFGGAIICGGVYFFMNDTNTKRRQSHPPKKRSLQKGRTTLDAASVQQGKSLRVSTAQTQRMVRTFRDKMDADHNNEVDQSEFINHCKSVDCDPFVAGHLFDAIDINNDDALNLDEIFEFVSKMEAGSIEEKLDCVFSFLAGGSNKHVLSRGACKKIFGRLGYDQNQASDMMKDIFHAAGSSKSARVSREDFVSAIANSDTNAGTNVIGISTKVVESVCGSKFEGFSM
jgi:Ca2+-binding EF-hand superfamily protein